MTANPIDLVGGLTTSANVPKADISAWAKARVPQVFASLTELRNTTLAAQLVVSVKANGTTYAVDTTDTTTADDGVSCIVSLDGLRFKPVSSVPLPTTASLGGVFSSVAVTNQYLTGIGTDGHVTRAQPSAADLSDGNSGTGQVVHVTGAALAALTALGVRSTGAAFDLTFATAEVLTAGRTLSWVLGDAARTITLGGNVTTTGAFSTAGAFAVTLTATGTTGVTLPTTGTLATLAGTEALTNKTINGLTLTASSGTLTLNTNTLGIAGSGVSLTLQGAGTTTQTFPTTSATLARTDAGQTFTGANTFGSLTTGNINDIGTLIVQSGAAESFAVGLSGATNPAFWVDSSVALQVAGLKLTGAVTGGTVALTAIDSGANTNVSLDAKGSGTVTINGTATGGITLARAVTLNSTINKVTLTAPATAATLTLTDGTTLTGPAASGTAMTLGNVETVTGAKTFNDAKLILAGVTSGTTTLKSGGTAGSSVITLPVATDTLMGKATTDTLTNKTFDTAGTGNSFSINGVAATANTGTGAIARAAGPTFTTPALGAATATTINGNALTAGTYTLTGAAGKTLTFSNSLTLAGTDATTMTFPTTSATLARTDAANTFTGHQTIEGVTSTGATGTGKFVFDTAPTISAPVMTGTVDIQQALTYSGDITPTQIVATTNDYAPIGFSTTTVVRISTDVSRDITGLAGGGDGRTIYILNVGSFAAVLKDEGAGSTAANRFGFGADLTLASKQGCALLYDSTASRWRQVGGPSASGGGSGTVTSLATTYPLSGGTITTSGTATYVGPTASGLLSYVSTTAIKFGPRKGDLLKINGVVLQIPAAGIVGVANTSVFVNGTGASNLANSTFYYVYAFSNSGTVTADFRTGAHSSSSTAGNIGTEILTGDDTRSLIGMIQTNSSGQFVSSATQQFVRSWFNDPGVIGSVGITNTTGLTSTTAGGVEITSTLRISLLTWSGELVTQAIGGRIRNGTTLTSVSIYPDFNGAASETVGSITFDQAVGGDDTPAATSRSRNDLTEGLNYATVFYVVSSGTAISNISNEFRAMGVR
jgi:hypothetical protein